MNMLYGLKAGVLAQCKATTCGTFLDYFVVAPPFCVVFHSFDFRIGHSFKNL
jgi:hypothetical protein